MTRRKLDPIRLWARDRRMAAIHEAGHVVIAKMLRVPVGPAYVYLTTGRRLDPLCHKTWRGKTHCGYQRAKKRQRLMIGVAGAVAELAWRGEAIDEDFWFEPTMMSASDWRLVECKPGSPDRNCINVIATVAEVLERGASHWPNLLTEARRLIINSRMISQANNGIVQARPLCDPNSAATLNCAENG
jgi:hypothetical protein